MLRKIYTQVLSPCLDIWTAKRFDTEGFYTIKPSEAIEPYELWLPGRGGFQRRRIRGELEPDVMDLLVERVNPGDTVFDVGAAWGYFSLALTSLGATVYAFEIKEERIRSIEKSSQRSGLDVTTVAGAAGDTVRLDEYPVPDLIKMDIEGWEYQALLSGKEFLEQNRPVLVIEYHSPEAALAPDAVDKDTFYALLHDCGYEITELDKRSVNNFHIIAE